MPHLIEPAKSGRAKCRKCREKIERDSLRFGHEVLNAFDDGGMSHQWYHLKCAAEKLPLDLASTLQTFDGDVPDREELDQVIAANRKKQKPTKTPYAEYAPSGRSSCQVCGEKIDKGELRIAVEREIDAGGFSRAGAGYLHPGCRGDYDDLPDDLVEQMRANSTTLEDSELDALEELL
ncbi:MAG: PARP-type zinc finger-containing protein [Pirellulaceae bacterium]|nr:PARP-type zinc finger-containing protein [Pirellulaceae bacterium]